VPPTPPVCLNRCEHSYLRQPRVPGNRFKGICTRALTSRMVSLAVYAVRQRAVELLGSGGLAVGPTVLRQRPSSSAIKHVQERTETVRDTVRRTEVDVEPVEMAQAKGACHKTSTVRTSLIRGTLELLGRSRRKR
jgi:hypothetical protein